MLVTAAWSCFGVVFLLSAAHHLLRFQELLATVAEHGVIPARAVAMRVYVLVEIAAGAGALGAGVVLPASPRWTQTCVAALLLVITAGLTSYVRSASRRSAGLDCGCGPLGSSMGHVVLARNLVLTAVAAALVVAISATHYTIPDRVPYLLSVVSGVLLGLLSHATAVGWSVAESIGRQLRAEHAGTT
jgi:hypothetical protein